MKNLSTLIIALFLGLTVGHAEEYHVAKSGSDLNPGTKDAPFLTISKAAAVARSGDVITVHAGTYREWVNPRNSGSDKYARITYQAAEGEEVWIKGSEQITTWTREKKSDVWKVVLPNSYFGDFNPYTEILAGDWVYYTQPYVCLGEVYLNGKALWQTGTLEGVKDTSEHLCWYVEVDDSQTVIYANFGGSDPNKEL
ncbi:MAG: DUF1565 domain-containing protein, partial [Bacteroidales bacterium]|nr:DUF1565 domain-containing protein [Bacteroidales bacterium]